MRALGPLPLKTISLRMAVQKVPMLEPDVLEKSRESH